LAIKEIVDYIATAVRSSIREDNKMDWEWLYDLRTAGDILGMTPRQLVLFCKQNKVDLYRNKFNNYKFLTAAQIRQLREMVLERASADDCYPQRKRCKVPIGQQEAPTDPL